MKKDPKLEAAFELKKKIEKDLGVKASKKEKLPKGNQAIRSKPSYHLDFGEAKTLSDLYNLDFNVSDEMLADLIENSSLAKERQGCVFYLRKEFDKALETFLNHKDPESMYNAFFVMISNGDLRGALKQAIELKNAYPLSPLGYLALSHVLFFLEDERWEESFKLYLSMSNDKLAQFVWSVFNNSSNIKPVRNDSRRYLLDIGMYDSSDKIPSKEVLFGKICERSYNPCNKAFCNVIKAKNNVAEEKHGKNCILADYAHALDLYFKGDFSKALLCLPKIRDPEFLYLEALCHYSLDESDGFNSVMSEITKIEPKSKFFLSLSRDTVKSVGLAKESSSILEIKVSSLEKNYYASLRKLMFEFSRLKGYLPSKIDFSLKIRKYHIMRMFFGYRTCKGVYSQIEKK